MDNVTHTLTGLALARAGLNRFSPHAVALLILSANAPDVDIVAAARGALSYLEWHRGYTHSLLAVPLLAALSVLAIAAAFRQRLPWAKAWLLCVVGVSSHILLDWTNSYGTRLLLPFSSRWFHLDITALYDGWIMAALVLAAIWPAFSRLVNREIGSREVPGRGIAIFALLFFLVFDCTRSLLHGRAIAQLQARLFDNAAPLRASAVPYSFSPFQWSGIVETERTFQAVPVNPLSELDPASAQVFFKPPEERVIEAAQKAESFRFFLYFARFPVWSESRVSLDSGPGVRVELTDLRFGRPQGGSFHCVAVEDRNYRVLQDWFTFGSGLSLGWGKGGPPSVDQQ